MPKTKKDKEAPSKLYVFSGDDELNYYSRIQLVSMMSEVKRGHLMEWHRCHKLKIALCETTSSLENNSIIKYFTEWIFYRGDKCCLDGNE